MKHPCGGDLTAQPTRVLTEFDECCGYCGEEQAIDQRGVALGQRVQLVGQREHEMEIRHRQELRAPGGEPAFLGERLTLRAVAIAARVVGVALRTTGIALRNMAAQCARATRADRTQRALLHAGEPMRGAECRAMRTHDIGELDSPTVACRIRTVRMRAHGALWLSRGRSLEQVQWRGGARQVFLRQMKVARSGAQTAMPHQALDRMHIHARFQQMRGEGMTQGMDAARFGDAGALLRCVIDALRAVA